MLKQSLRAATPFLISKQPYFPLPPPFFYVAASSSSSVSRASPASLWFSLAREPRRFITPAYFSALNVPATVLPFASLSSRARSFRERSPFLARFLAARSSARTRVAPISLPRHFRPPFPSFPLHDLLFSFSSPSPLSYYFSSLIGSFALLTGVICRGRYIGGLV